MTGKQIAKHFAPYFPNDWRLINSQFYRLDGDWVQIVGFNVSRLGGRKYEPMTGCEYLKVGGPVCATWLATGLKNPNGTQRRVYDEDTNFKQLFADMDAQFIPKITLPFISSEIPPKLNEDLNYWPYLQVLCLIAVDQGNKEESQYYWNLIHQKLSSMPSEWIWPNKTLKDLSECLALIDSPDQLAARLNLIREAKIKAMKLDLPPKTLRKKRDSEANP